MSAETIQAIEASSLDVIVPENSNFDLSNFLQPQNNGDGRLATALPLSSIPRRHLLYFGGSPPPESEALIVLLILGYEQTNPFRFT